jgi:adenosylcobinamide-phosphate synthase
LGIQLGGGHFYFGQWTPRTTIGDALRLPRLADIIVANRLMLVTACLGLVLGGLASWLWL